MIMNGPHWIKQWIADLAMLNEQFRDENGTVDFEALGREEFQFRTALITRNFEKSERAKTVFENAKAAYDASVKNGKKGGRPRKETIQGDAGHREAPDESATDSNNSEARQVQARESRRTGAEPRGVSHSAPVRLPSYDEFTRFVDAQGLDYTDAREWWEMTMVDRAGKDRDGKPIRNWKITCRRFCEAKAKNRRSA